MREISVLEGQFTQRRRDAKPQRQLLNSPDLPSSRYPNCITPAERDSMGTTKEEAIKLLNRLPDEVTWDDIIYEMYVMKKTELGINAANEGRVIPQEEVRKLFW